MLPTGQAHLMVNLDEDEFRTYSGTNCGIVHHAAGAVLAGPRGRPTAIDTSEQRRLIAVEFKFGGAAAFLPMPISEACDQVVELENIWERDGVLLRERLCEARTLADKFRVLEAVLLEGMVRSWDPAIAAVHAETHAAAAQYPPPEPIARTTVRKLNVEARGVGMKSHCVHFVCPVKR
jgi:hypothetical protein